jgi:predicted ATP-grasp superfamily ATP-dependent carboligase
VLVPSPYEDLLGYKEALRSLALRPDVVTIIPVREADVYVLAKYRDEFAGHVRTPWPDMDHLRRVQDRVTLFEAADAAGVSAPDTTLLARDSSLEGEWIAKSRYSILTAEYCTEYTAEMCTAPPSTMYLDPETEPDIDQIYDAMGHVPLRQEFVDTTDEYGFFALYDHGDPLATFQHRQQRGWSYAGGPSAFRRSVSIPALERDGLALLDELDWHGLAMVEFLRDEETGEFQLMEVNPRFWSSLPFSVQAGADFPYHYWLLAADRADQIDTSYETDVGGHLVRGELLYLYSILTEDNHLVDPPALTDAVSTVAQSMWDHPRFDYLSRSDPGPFVQDVRNTYNESITKNE